VLIVSMNRDRDLISCVLSNGAFGYIHKFDFAAEIMTAISAALRNSIYVSTEIESIIANSD
jgi:DNA-binding NarL/FixJ family response regulator